MNDGKKNLCCCCWFFFLFFFGMGRLLKTGAERTAAKVVERVLHARFAVTIIIVDSPNAVLKKYYHKHEYTADGTTMLIFLFVLVLVF